jgi:hypothetical protein
MITDVAFVSGWLNWLDDILNSQEDENREFPKCSGVLCPNK